MEHPPAVARNSKLGSVPIIWSLSTRPGSANTCAAMNSLRGRFRLPLHLIPFAALAWLVLPGAPAAELAPKPLFPGITPVRSCESLTNFSLPNTTIESVVMDTTNGMCLVTAIVTHPPAGDRVKVWVGLPLTNWNGRFQGKITELATEANVNKVKERE